METAWLDNLAHAATLLGPAPGRFVVAREHLIVSGPGTVAVTVKPTSRGRRLIAHHRYPVVIRLWVSFTPTYGTQRNLGLYAIHIGVPNTAVTTAERRPRHGSQSTRRLSGRSFG